MSAFDQGIYSVEDIAGAILPGSKLYFYTTGTSTPLATYSDQGLTTPNANPVVAGADGRFGAIWLQATSYKIVLKTAADATLVTRDPVRGDIDTGLTVALAASGGSALIGFLQSGTGAAARTAQAKMRETVSVLDFGAVGDGATDDYTAITNALLTGKHAVFPEGYTFLTAGNHSITTSYQMLVINGTVKKKSGTAQEIFVVQDQVEGVTFTGGGVLDGNRTAFAGGNRGSGILAYRAISLTVDGVTFQNFIDDGIKAHNCPNLVVTKATRFYNIYNIGVEMRSYANDPRTAIAWVGTVYGPSGDIDGFYDRIDDGLHGAGNGVGVDFSPADTALPIKSLRVSGRFRDCLRAIFSENNYTGTTSVSNILIDNPIIEGNYRGVGTVETKDGIGLIGVIKTKIVGAQMLNIGNFAPAGGSCAGIQISTGCSEIDIVDAQIHDTTGATDRTDYGINIAAGSKVRITGGAITGASIAMVNKDASVTDCRIDGVMGSETDYSWGNVTRYTFSLANIPTGAATSLLADSSTAIDANLLGCAGRVVGQAVRMSAAGTGNFTFKVLVATVEQTGVEISQAAFGGGASAVKKISTSTALQGASGAQLTAVVTTDGTWVNTVDAKVDVFVDHGMKS